MPVGSINLDGNGNNNPSGGNGLPPEPSTPQPEEDEDSPLIYGRNGKKTSSDASKSSSVWFFVFCRRSLKMV